MNKKNSERGQVLVLLAAGMIGLIGLMALAIDGGSGFADRRHAQNAADNAAYAAAYSWVDTANTLGAQAASSSTAWRDAGLNIIAENDYNNTNTTLIDVSLVDAPDDICPPDSDGVYITATIDSFIDTWFATIVGVEQMNNHVTARSQACLTYTTNLVNGSAMAGLNQIDEKAVYFHGSGRTDIVGSGVFSNSSNQCGLEKSGNGNANAGVYVPNLVTVAGSFCENGNGGNGSLASIGNQSTGQQITNIDGYLAGMPDPEDWCTTTMNASSLNGSLDPGIYCIHGDWKGNANLSGGGVTLIFLDGEISWTGNGSVSLSAPTDGPFKGYAIYMPLSNPKAAFHMGGTPDYCIKGTILVPGGHVSLLGTTGVLASQNCGGYGIVGQVVADTVEVGGTADMNILYNAENPSELVVPPSIELVD